MHRTLFTGVLCAAGVGLAMTAPAAAEKDTVAQACLDRLQELSGSTTAGAVTGPVAVSEHGRDLIVLRNAAINLGESGHDEACSAVIDRIAELQEQRAAAIANAKDQNADGAARTEALQDAKPITDVTGPLRATEVIGMEVHTLSGEILGTVEDIASQTTQDGGHFLLVAHGGVLGFGQDLTPVALATVRVAPTLNALVIDIAAERFETAPTVKWADGEIGGEDGAFPSVAGWWSENAGG